MRRLVYPGLKGMRLSDWCTMLERNATQRFCRKGMSTAEATPVGCDISSEVTYMHTHTHTTDGIHTHTRRTQQASRHDEQAGCLCWW